MSDLLFQDLFFHERRNESLGDGAMVLGGFALGVTEAIVSEVEAIALTAPFRHLKTPSGHTMSAAMTNCGAMGWISDARGYRYEGCDPLSGTPWPEMPPLFVSLAQRAADAAGYSGFIPDACLINLYVPGAKMSLHQDRDEPDRSAPIVSVSLGMPATFLWGGLMRTSPVKKVALRHGDVVVFGGASRLNFHGISPLKDGEPSVLGGRVNLTFRKTR